jgi:polyhydroxyalkanoate synthesis regulator phasin
MKYILTESQFRLLSEQDTGYTRYLDKMYSTPEGAEKMNKSFKDADPHALSDILGLVTFFIPVIGPAISAGISLGDAALYYKEGDKKTATMTAIFPFLPFGKIGKLIPASKKIGKEGMENLAKKLGKEGGKGLTELEKQVVDGMVKNKELLNQEMKKISDDLVFKSSSRTTKLPLGKLGQDFKALLSQNSGWLQIKDGVGNLSGWKFHVYGDNLDEVAYLYEKLLPVVNKYGAGIKVATLEMLEKLANNPLQKGKAVTLYLPSSVVARNLQKDFLKDIQSSLKGYNKSGQIAGDRMITDNIGYRYELSRPINSAKGVDMEDYKNLYSRNQGGSHNLPNNPDLFR